MKSVERLIAKARYNSKLLKLNNVEFVNAGIEKLPLLDESVDVVISNPGALVFARKRLVAS